MQVIARRTLREFWELHADSETALTNWYGAASKARWETPQDVKDQFGNSVDFVGDSRIAFDIGGNKYRLIVHVAYPFGRVLVKFIGTHRQYDQIDAETV
jgi:mRNA interferase HigB